jgi:hypothetical protein
MLAPFVQLLEELLEIAKVENLLVLSWMIFLIINRNS